jgi:hypothetical protein
MTEFNSRSGTTSKLEVPNFDHLIPPRFEETPGGKATLRATTAMEASAEELRQVTGLVGQVSSRVSELHEIVISQLLPTWVTNLKDSADAAQQSLNVSLSGVKVALWTAAGSAILACLLTLWQVSIAHDYKVENDQQQARMEVILKAQLKATQALNANLSGELSKSRDELARLSKSVSVNTRSSKPDNKGKAPAPKRGR